MDDVDRRLIIELQSDPRQNNRRLAKSIGIAEATVHRRIEQLVSSGSLILTVLPDLRKLGYSARVYFGLQTELSKSIKIAEQLSQSPYLSHVGTCQGFADLLIRGDFKSTEELTDFISGYLGKIDGISRIDTMIQLRELKRRSYRIGISNPTATSAPQTSNVFISETDRRLILDLQKDCRASLKELAYELGVSRVTVYRRIKELVGSGVIELTALSEPTKLGYRSRTFIGLETQLSKLGDVAESITRYPQVQFAGFCSGPVQIFAIIYESTPESLTDFTINELGKIGGIVRIVSATSLKVYKEAYTWLQR